MTTGKTAYETFIKNTSTPPMFIVGWNDLPPHVKGSWEELVNSIRNDINKEVVYMVEGEQEKARQAQLEVQDLRNRLLSLEAKKGEGGSITSLAKEIHATAVEKGWYDCEECDGTGTDTMRVNGVCAHCNHKGKKKRNFGEVIALMHSELSEALEEFRAGHDFNEIYSNVCINHGKPEGIGIELADCIIRILDTCVEEEVDIEKCIKLEG